MTRVVVLAAGEGTRLRPLTQHLPKALVPFAGTPLLVRQLRVLARAGLTHVSVVAGHCAEAFEPFGTPLFLNARYASTNMVTSLHEARALFDGADDVLVTYGDIVYEPRVLHAVLYAQGPISIAVDLGWLDLWRLRMEDPLTDAESMKLDAHGCIIELGHKPTNLQDINGQYIGLFKISREFAAHFFERYEQWPVGDPFENRPLEMMYMTSYLQHQIDHGVIARAVTFEHGWLEIDSIQDLQRYEAEHAAGRLSSLYDPEA